jgi:hypothetical protein
MPTTHALDDYVQRLPALYREILSAFPRIEPTRRAGYGLAFQSLSADFEERGVNHSVGEIILACQELAKYGLVEIKHNIFVHPTARGEELIAALTGHQPAELSVEPLPPPPV